MAFTIRNMFSSGDAPEGSATVNAPEGQGSHSLPAAFASSPFAMAAGSHDAHRPEAPANMGGLGNPGVPVFKPISEESFRTGALEPRHGGGGSPFLSMGDQTPPLVVADILPSLPPDVARGNGAPMDQAVHLSPAIIDAARHDGSYSVALFEVFRVCPALFQVPVSPADPRRVRIPKLAAQSSPPASPVPPAPAPSPFGMAQSQPSPSPFAAAPSPAPTGMPQPGQPAPASRPIGTLPPRRPDGVPPAIPTQSDFAVAPTLHLPGGLNVPGQRDTASPGGESPFAMAFSAQPTSPAASNFISPPKPEVPEVHGFGGGPSGSPFTQAATPPVPSFGASPFAEAVGSQSTPSPFLSSPAAPPAPKSGPLGGMFSPPISQGGAPAANPFAAQSAPAPSGPESVAPHSGTGNVSPFGSFPPAAPTTPDVSPPRAPSRPLAGGPASRPLLPPDMPAGVGETVEMPLSSIVKGHSPQDLGFDPNFIPAWIMTKLPAYLVKQQVGAAEIRVELGAVIDGTDETFRPIISHGKRDFKVKLPHNDVFHALPQVSSPTAQPAFPAAPAPAAPVRPAQEPPASPAPVQPVGLQGLTSAFALGTFGSQTRPQEAPPAPPAPPSRPLFTPAAEPPAAPPTPSVGWQSAAAPAPLFSQAPQAPAADFGAPPAMSLPVSPMPEIQQSAAAPSLFAPAANEGFRAPQEPAALPSLQTSAPTSSAQPVPMAISSGAGGREQMMLRALLGTDGHLNRESVVQHVARMPGVEACVFVSGPQVLRHGAASAAAAEFLRQGEDLSRSLKTLAAAVGIGQAETLSVNSDSRLVTFSFHESSALGILHTDRECASGLKEKVALICRELAAMPAA